jgi:hypothetical protein
MRKWDVYIQGIPAGKNGRPRELEALLDEGWEPFGLATHGKIHIALRRRRDGGAPTAENGGEERTLLADEIFLR